MSLRLPSKEILTKGNIIIIIIMIITIIILTLVVVYIVSVA